MGLLSYLRELSESPGDSPSDARARQELEQIRAQAEAIERGETVEGKDLGPKLRRSYHFVGTVQGVGFRFTATNLAHSVGATGWVRNEHDGSVTAEIQGIAEQIDAVIDGLNRYYNGGRYFGGFSVEDVRELDVISGERDFRPIY